MAGLVLKAANRDKNPWHVQVWGALHRLVCDVCEHRRSGSPDRGTEGSTHATAQSCLCHFQNTALPLNETCHGCSAEATRRAHHRTLRPLPVVRNAEKLVRAAVNLWEAEIGRITGTHTQRPAPRDFPVWRPLFKQRKRALAASCAAAQSMEWAISRVVEVRCWAQCAVRRRVIRSQWNVVTRI